MGQKAKGPPLGIQVPLTDSPPPLLKFQKRLAGRKYITSKFSSLPP